MLHLKNERLEIEIQEPGEIYAGSRFDWTGFITQITLDDTVTYCVPEQQKKGKGTGGLGFCNEFGIDKPIGYNAIKTGEFFPKIGVGLLKKETEEAYDFFKAYELIPSDATVEKNQNTLRFKSEASSSSGYGYHLIKDVTLEVNRLTLSYELTNTGSQPLVTTEYSHNFIGINNQLIGPEYELSLPKMTAIDVAVGSVDREGQKLTWGETPEADFYAAIEWNHKDGDCNWNLYHKQICAGVRDISVLTPSKVALWGYTHVVCPELFIDIDLKAGETKKWERVYEFYQNR
ncbi:hypothetical protein ADIAL_1596 [Alkalibacterium sp. AK22]|uniref:hypothetical protein n=1 Tax=Alkalibacterium sp. AK22 TaxID=1229520 RepID=UPI00044A12DF|nr:hypothetical protein [Alkalibacterium sp. AK22]EXJ22973.1 hypothetical protein ADIAL_1596 [Alkalibacterium sp. AK22]